MKGDFSRLTFNPTYTRVLMQQGRVVLDSDWNEQSGIFWHYLRGLAEDLGGPHWGPADSLGFEISPDGRSFMIGPGRYYVRGLRCDNDAPVSYENQPGYPFPDSVTAEHLKKEETYLAYLEVWERHISYIEDPSIRDPALGGTDTAVRSQITWQVKIREWRLGPDASRSYGRFLDVLLGTQHAATARLKARAAAAPGNGRGEGLDPSSDSPYGGLENSLYRVQIHDGGPAGDATFKWSRENVVIVPIETLQGRLITLGDVASGDPRIEAGDWVELVDDDYVLRTRADPLIQVEAADHTDGSVLLATEPTTAAGRDPSRHPQLWRWDQEGCSSAAGALEVGDEGTLPVREGPEDSAWLHLENGVQVQFQAAEDPAKPSYYRTGDYWLIPARTDTSDIEWPRTASGDALAQSPDGTDRFYAPLALVKRTARGIAVEADLRLQMKPLSRSL